MNNVEILIDVIKVVTEDLEQHASEAQKGETEEQFFASRVKLIQKYEIQLDRVQQLLVSTEADQKMKQQTENLLREKISFIQEYLKKIRKNLTH